MMYIQNPGQFMKVLKEAEKALNDLPEGTALRKSIQEIQKKCPHIKVVVSNGKSGVCPDCLKNVRKSKFPRVRVFDGGN